MTIEEIFARVGDQVSVRRVFGEPIERDGITIVPVAVVAGGGGGGQGPEETGSGGGVGICSRGLGVFAIREGQVRFVPAIDVMGIGVLAVIGVGLIGKSLRKRRRHH